MAAKTNKKPAKAKKAAAKKPVAKKPAAKKPVAKKPEKKAKPVKVAKPAKEKVKAVKKAAPVKAAKPAPKPEVKKPEVKKVESKKPSVKPPPPMKKMPPPPPAPKTPAKIVVPSRIIKKEPVAVKQSPESIELIKRTSEAKKLHAEAEAKKQAEAAMQKTSTIEKKHLEKRPMIVQHTENQGEDEKKFYSREELEEFRQIINVKMEEAKEEYSQLLESLQETNELGADSHNMTEFGSDTIDKEQTEMFLARQKKFIQALERALVRIENGTYGRCKVTGKLIPKERLRLVPHTESSIQAKQQQYDRTGSVTSLMEEN